MHLTDGGLLLYFYSMAWFTNLEFTKMKRILLLISAIVFAVSANAQSTYTFDKNHARLSFSVLHFGISHIEGIFKTFDATFVSTKGDFSDAIIEMTADVNSINTEVEMRDTDLRDNWFETKKFPSLTFKSTSFKKVSGNIYTLKGNLTMHGITKPVDFDVVFNGKALNPMSKKSSLGFTITGKLNRIDFGIGVKSLSSDVSYKIELKSNVEFIIN
jgi:polyisoprenoid-binding protein YceI